MKLKNILISVLCLFASMAAYAQASDVVTLTVTGEGATKEEATTVALRDAVSQAFGVFVSANTTILNDELVKDEIATISSGNIQKYSELSSIVMPNGAYSVTLSATVSIGNLISYAKNHGSSVELSGQTFAMNMKIYRLNKKNEYEALLQIMDYLKSLGNSLFNYSISTSEPVLVNDTYIIKATISAYGNSNFDKFQEYVHNILSSISLKWNEVEEWEKRGVKVAEDYIFGKPYWLRTDPSDLKYVIDEIEHILSLQSASWDLIMETSKTTLYRANIYADFYEQQGVDDLKDFQLLSNENVLKNVIRYQKPKCCGPYFNLHNSGVKADYEIKFIFTEDELLTLKGFEVKPNMETCSKALDEWANATKIRAIGYKLKPYHSDYYYMDFYFPYLYNDETQIKESLEYNANCSFYYKYGNFNVLNDNYWISECGDWYKKTVVIDGKEIEIDVLEFVYHNGKRYYDGIIEIGNGTFEIQFKQLKKRLIKNL